MRNGDRLYLGEEFGDRLPYPVSLDELEALIGIIDEAEEDADLYAALRERLLRPVLKTNSGRRYVIQVDDEIAVLLTTREHGVLLGLLLMEGDVLGGIRKHLVKKHKAARGRGL